MASGVWGATRIMFLTWTSNLGLQNVFGENENSAICIFSFKVDTGQSVQPKTT